MIQFIAPEAHHQVPLLLVVAADQAKRFSWAWAELGFHPEPWCQFPQEGNRAIGVEVVEAQGHQSPAAPPPIGGQQVKLASQAVAKPQRSPKGPAALLKLATRRAEGTPGIAGLTLMIEPGHIGPGMHRQPIRRQLFQQPAVADLGGGRQIAAADEFDQSRGFGRPQLPDRTQLTPVGHAQPRS